VRQTYGAVVGAEESSAVLVQSVCREVLGDVALTERRSVWLRDLLEPLHWQ
jgi:hypothetical protein